MQRARKNGFTLVELVVSVAVAAILIGISYAVFIAQRRGHVVQEQVAEMQQGARVASDTLTRALMGIGTNIDRPNPADPTTWQQQLLFCGPHELIFNSDVTGGTTADAITAGRTITTSTTPTVTLTAAATFQTAETYRYALEPSGDGRHFNLVREMFAASAAPEKNVVALNLSETDTLKATTEPLFRYWGDFDADSATDLWGDADNDGELDTPAEYAAAMTPITPASLNALGAYTAGKTPDQVIRRIEVHVIGETQNPDPQFAARYAGTAGYRQTIIRSNIVPRNLWECPVIVAPAPYTNDHNALADQVTAFTFTVMYHGQPMPDGQIVTFSIVGTESSNTPNPNRVSLTSTVGQVVGSGGQAVVQIKWPACGAFASGPLHTTLAAGTPLTYTVTATVPSMMAPSGGSCPAVTEPFLITVNPGPADMVRWVSRVANPAGTVDTCGTDFVDLTFQVVNKCGDIPVPLHTATHTDTLQLYTSTADVPPAGTPFGRLNGSLALSGLTDAALTADHKITVRYTAPTSWPSPSPGRDPASGDFTAFVGAQLTGKDESLEKGATTPPPEIRLHPTPRRLQNLQGIAGPYLDCSVQRHEGTFEIADCFGNLIFSLNTPPYGVATSVVPGASPPADQGVATFGGPDGAHPGTYFVDYDTPWCTLGPPSGQTRTPTLGLNLTQAGTSLHTLTAPVALQSCAQNCSVTITPISPCTHTATVVVTGCNLAGAKGELVVSTGGSSVSFAGGNQATTTIPVTFDASNTASATLYIWSAIPRDVVTVTANYPTAAAPAWSCSGTTTVGTACEKLTIEGYNTQTKSWEVIDNQTGQSCLNKISSLRAKVTDCQFSTATLSRAVTFYLVGANYVDYEEMDLEPEFAGDPTTWKTTKALTFKEDTTGIPTPNDRVNLTFPPGSAVWLMATYKDTSGHDPRDDSDLNGHYRVAQPTLPLAPAEDLCRKVVSLTTPLPICFPNAITSGGGGGWNGNFQVHWGDVVIQGDVELAPTPKFIEKLGPAGAVPAAQFDGNVYKTDQTDRFFDIYVGRKTNPATGLQEAGRFTQGHKTYAPLDPSKIDRPFIAGGAGYKDLKLTTSYGNYYQNISEPKILDMMTQLDYEIMKRLAQESTRKAYWYALDDSIIYNPATGKTCDISTVLNVAATNTCGYDGQFIFIDGFSWLANGAATDNALVNKTPDDCSLATNLRLPCFDIGSSGKFFTKGIIYIAGSATFKGGGSGQTIANAMSPPEWDTQYKHNDPTWEPADPDLPIRSDPGQVQRNIALTDINLSGGFYLDGHVGFSGSPKIFGAVSAERGFLAGGTPEIWYNYGLNTNDQQNTLCVNCCSLELDPSALRLPECGSATIVPILGAGSVLWSSTNPALSVAGGTVWAPAGTIGQTSVIRGVDKNNCTATTSVTVVPLTMKLYTNQVLRAQATTLEVDAPAGTTLDWSVSPAGTATVTPQADTRKATFTAGGMPGTVDVTATIRGASASCNAAQATITIN